MLTPHSEARHKLSLFERYCTEAGFMDVRILR